MSKENQHISTKVKEEQPYRYVIWQKLGSSASNRWSLRLIYLLIFLAIFGDFLANDRPLYYQEEGQTHWPIFRQYAQDLGLAVAESASKFTWQERAEKFESVIWAPIRYSASTSNLLATNISPFSEKNKAKGWRRHWLGTDQNGRDVAAGMIAGCRIALLVGLCSMLVAALLGLCLGSLAGYYGNQGLIFRRSELIGGILGAIIGTFYGFSARAYAWQEGQFFVQFMIALGILVISILLFARLLSLIPLGAAWHKRVKLPADGLIMRLIEIINSVPALLFLLAILAIVERSIWTMILVIGVLSWTTIARFVRAELLRIRQLEYIDAARSIGLKESKILIRHALPNALQPVLITLAFGVASAILVEAYLSFLGIGLPENVVTWGNILAEARSRFSSWWLVIFPGFAIFITVTIFNILGESLSEATGDS